MRVAHNKAAALKPKPEPKPKPVLKSQVSKSSDDISTTVGMDELAISPPHMAWDPEFLLELDPRYGEVIEAETEAEAVEDEADESEVVWDSEDDDEETYYQSDEYTDRGGRDDTEFYTESEGEFLDKHDDGETTCREEEEETDFDDRESEHYKTPGIPRPVLR